MAAGGSGSGQQPQDPRAVEVLTQQPFQAGMDMRQGVVEPVDQTSGLIGQVRVIPGQHGQLHGGLLVRPHPSKRVRRVRAASAMMWASRASVLPSPGYRSAILRIDRPGR
jgi:hypothetical protein